VVRKMIRCSARAEIVTILVIAASQLFAAAPPSVSSPAPAASQPAGVPDVPVCAIIADQAVQEECSALIGLLEAKLSGNGKLRLVERNEIDKVLKEQELQLLFAPQGVARRSALGSLLKADLLILLRAVKEGADQKALHLTICETRSGLRLRLATVKSSDKPEDAALQIVILVDEALDKFRSPVRHVVATPDFVSKDLSYQYDYLKTFYARLVDQRLVTEPELVVVELAEARAIGEELALADKTKVVRRPLPFYLMGEYRTTAEGDRLYVQTELSLRQGEKVLGTRKADRLTDTEALSFIPKTSLELLRETIGTTASRPDPATEAKQLSDRAQVFMQTANWEEALRLTEAAILLTPDDPALHERAADMLDKKAAELCYHDDRSVDSTLSTPEGQKEYVIRGTRLLSCYARMTEHIKAYLKLTSPCEPRGLWASIAHPRNIEVVWATYDHATSKPARQIRAALEELYDSFRRDLLDILEHKLESEHAARDILRAVENATGIIWKTDGISIRYFQVIQNVEGGRARILELLGFRHSYDHTGLESEAGSLDHLDGECAWWLLKPEAAQIIEALEAMPGKETQAAAATLRQWRGQAPERLAGIESRLVEQKADFLANDRGDTFVSYREPGVTITIRLKKGQTRWSESTDSRLPRSQPAKPPDDVTLTRLRLTFEDESGRQSPIPDGHLLGWIPCLPGVDVVWTATELFVMRHKGRLIRIVKTEEEAFGRRLAADWDPHPVVCFDGKYLWAPAALSKEPYLLAIDLESGKSRRITTADGLPPMRLGLCVAPIAPGRVCVAAAFGKPDATQGNYDRSWCCQVELEDSGSVKVRTLLEATKQPAPRNVHPMSIPEPDVIFVPSGLVPLRDKIGKHVSAMLLITAEGVGIHLDLQTGSVKSLPGAAASPRGRLNFSLLMQLTFEPTDLLFQPGPGSFGGGGASQSSPALETAPFCTGVVKDGVIYAYANQFLIARDLSKPMQQLTFHQPERPPFLGRAQLYGSNHYGMVLVAEYHWSTGQPVFAVEVRPGALEILDHPPPVPVEVPRWTTWGPGRRPFRPLPTRPYGLPGSPAGPLRVGPVAPQTMPAERRSR